MVVDLNKNVLKEHTRAFVPVFQEAQKRMRKVLQNCAINSLVTHTKNLGSRGTDRLLENFNDRVLLC